MDVNSAVQNLLWFPRNNKFHVTFRGSRCICSNDSKQTVTLEIDPSYIQLLKNGTNHKNGIIINDNIQQNQNQNQNQDQLQIHYQLLKDEIRELKSATFQLHKQIQTLASKLSSSSKPVASASATAAAAVAVGEEEEEKEAVHGNGNGLTKEVVNIGNKVNQILRSEMKNYWDMHAKSQLTNSLMMLMKDTVTSEKFAQQEKEEILSYLPDFEGRTIAQLGAGVGRFTADFAKKASALLAVDFCEEFIVENERLHKHLYPNTKFMCEDVCKLEIAKESYDLVFSNWLLMYLSDEEVVNLAMKMYEWCTVSGHIFFRESCEGGASGDRKRDENPTEYRSHKTYLRVFDNIRGLKRLETNQVQIYLKQKNKNNQYYFLYQKVF